ncbi:NTE family protein [Paraburkholderia sp. JPY465]|uniref:patatin-like phospholipase family protein n=1 Tax=Paraburkholderia sp. JPY465 TaxID=3042285 RepID=UPI003D24FDED
MHTNDDTTFADSSGVHDTPEPAFVVFQGGGAKGIVHVGALAAVEELGIRIKGVAGTSAGAMIAALSAAGYSSKEMLDTATRSNIIASLGARFRLRGPTDLFSRKGWAFIRVLRLVVPRLKWTPAVLAMLVVLLGALEMWRPFTGMAVGVLLLLIGGGAYVAMSRGVSSVQRVRDFVDHAIAVKSRGRHEADVTFRQLRAFSGMPLKVVATNVTDQCVEVFSYERTPDVVVADAVAASICLPVVFRPWSFFCQRSSGVRADVARRAFLDGGVTSNLPVWTLDRERAAAGDLPTIAFSIQPDHRHDGRGGHWAGALMSSIIAGSMEIHTRAVDRMVHVPISCSLDLFDFDAKLRDLCEAVDKARDAVADVLDKQLTELPTILRSGCRQIAETAVALLQAEDRVWWENDPSEPAQFKVAFAVQAPREWQLSTPYHFGYANVRGPDIDPEILDGAWENLDPGWYTAPRDEAWNTDHHVILLPVSHADEERSPGSRKHEQPLVVVIETDIRVRSSDSTDEFESFLADLGESVVAFVEDYRVYEAVQRSTGTS